MIVGSSSEPLLLAAFQHWAGIEENKAGNPNQRYLISREEFDIFQDEYDNHWTIDPDKRAQVTDPKLGELLDKLVAT
jgi:hypothetical protein